MAADVKAVRIGNHGDSTRIVLDMDAKTPFRAFIMKTPSRLAIDLPSYDWKVGAVNIPRGGIVTHVRQGALSNGVSRIVVDLKGPAAIQAAFTMPAASGQREGTGARLVIDLRKPIPADTEGRVFGTLKDDAAPVSPAAETSSPVSSPVNRNVKSSTAAKTLPPVIVTAPETVKPEPSVPNNLVVPKVRGLKKTGDDHAVLPGNGAKPLIVIDPGHGGIDPGSLGVGGIFEKNVTIGMARALKKALEGTGRYQVLMTRNDDTFIPLGGRVAFARTHHANLFVSLHADSIARSNIQGASIYTLSDKASDEQSAKLAARENRADAIGGLNVDTSDDQVASILVDLVMRDTMNQSKFFANNVVDEMRADGITLLENTQRSAGFAVLKAPDIPSVLIELGFMTNAKESSMLISDSYREKVSRALVSGIDNYFRTIAKTARP